MTIAPVALDANAAAAPAADATPTADVAQQFGNQLSQAQLGQAGAGVMMPLLMSQLQEILGDAMSDDD